MLYKLKARYWDGRIRHPAGAILDFPEGGAPKSAEPVLPKPEPETTKAPAAKK